MDSNFDLTAFRQEFLINGEGWGVSDCYKPYDDKFLRRDAQDAYEGAKWAWQHQQAKVEELQKRVDELERMFEIKWTDEQIAPQGHSGNRIIYGDCVLGRFSIWWRTWKAWDRPELEINDEFITEGCDVEETKQLAKEYLEQALKGEG
ncbi:hypothetical protein [Acinetobacter pittii]|uniref:hypothetical protein n=1 Tax=Acinetobacter pittii TaxID=48296 RepID=UPI00300CF175